MRERGEREERERERERERSRRLKRKESGESEEKGKQGQNFVPLIFFGIITVNPSEFWPVYTLPIRDIKLITLPPCTSIRYPPLPT